MLTNVKLKEKSEEDVVAFVPPELVGPEDSATIETYSSDFKSQENAAPSSRSSSEPVERQEISAEGICLYIFGPWSGFFGLGLGLSIFF